MDDDGVEDDLTSTIQLKQTYVNMGKYSNNEVKKRKKPKIGPSPYTMKPSQV